MSKVIPLDREGDYILIGKYDFGDEVIGVLGDPTTGNGNVCMSCAQTRKDAVKAYHSKVEGMSYVVIGLDHARWAYCLSVLLHEIYELAYMRLDVRFACVEHWNRSHADYFFFMNHEQMNEAHARCAPFLTHAMVDVCDVYRRVTREKKANACAQKH